VPVVDASAVVELLLGGERAEWVLPWFESEEGAIHAPGFLDVEVAQVLRRVAAAGIMEAARGAAAVEILQDLPVHCHPENPLVARIWQLRQNLTAYDAAYVALAEALDCPLLTFDAGLSRVPGLEVRLVPEEA
jgi:predicted nucleic acid-binding protein